MAKEESNNLHKQAKARLGFVSDDISGMSEDDILKTLQELQTHQIELETQNEELRLSLSDLDKQLQYFYKFYNHTPIEYLTVNNKGIIFQANLSAADMLGFEKNNLLNTPFTSLILDQDQDIFHFCRNRFFKTKRKQSCKLRMEKKHGTLFHAKLDCFAIPNIDEVTEQYQIIITDLTETRQAEQVLIESEERYHSLFENYENGIFIYNPETMIILDANPAMIKIYGYSLEELVGMNCLELSAEVQESREVHGMINKYGRSNVATRWHKKKDGTVFPLELQAFSVEKSGRCITYIVITDLTSRKQAEDALLESEEKYRKLFYKAQVAMFRTRISDGKLIDVNEEYAKMAGFSTIGDCIAHFHAGKAWVDQKSRKRMKRLLVKNGSVRDYEAEIIRVDGVKIWISISATSYPEKGFLEGSLEDITKRKEAYDQLKDMNIALDVLLKKRAQENQEIEENIFSNYELMIGPFLNKLKNTASNKNQQNLIDIIETSLNDIVNPFTKKISNIMMGLTQSEIQIANMIKQGFSNKEIAQTLNCSKRTIDTHRENIRKKLDLTNKKVNLKTYLLNLQNT